MSKCEPVVIGGVEYVPKSTAAIRDDGLPYVIIRSGQAGVFAGYLVKRTHDEVELTGARRCWKWAGAMTLTDLSQDGTKQPNDCRFSAPLSAITVLGVCEVIPASEKARESIEAVKIWK